MKTLNCSVSACRYCQYYNPIGRRGGTCNVLNVSVQGEWKACRLASEQFPLSLKTSEAIVA